LLTAIYSSQTSHVYNPLTISYSRSNFAFVALFQLNLREPQCLSLRYQQTGPTIAKLTCILGCYLEFSSTPHQAPNPNNYERALLSAPPQAIAPNPHTNLLNVYIYTACK
jgi:hypothetical protein